MEHSHVCICDTHLVLLKQVNIRPRCLPNKPAVVDRWLKANCSWQKETKENRGDPSAAFPVLLGMSYGCAPGSVTMKARSLAHGERSGATVDACCSVQMQLKQGRSSSWQLVASGLVVSSVSRDTSSRRTRVTLTLKAEPEANSPTWLRLTPLDLFLAQAEVSCII